MLTWKFLHVAGMFLTMLFFDGPSLAIGWAARTRDVRALRSVLGMVKLTDTFGILSLLAAVAFGVATGLTGSFDFTAGWLVLSYVLLAVTILVGGVMGTRWVGRIEQAAEASPDDEPSPDLSRLLADPRTRLLLIVPPALFIAIIFLMVTKPL